MASRAEQKEAARQARLAAEQAAAARSVQRRRLGMIAGVVTAAVIVAVVAILISSHSGSRPGLQTGAAASATARSVATEFDGIPQHGVTLGNPKAAVTIQYFGDLECPVCRALTLGEDDGGLPQLIAGPVRDGQVKLVYRSFETASRSVNDDRFVPQQVAAYAAGRQNRAWNYIELFYREQGSEDSRYVTEAFLQGLARQISGLSESTWTTDRKDSAYATQVAGDAKAASADGLGGTPTLVAFGPKRAEIVPASTGIPTFSEISSAIDAVR